MRTSYTKFIQLNESIGSKDSLDFVSLVEKLREKLRIPIPSVRQVCGAIGPVEWGISPNTGKKIFRYSLLSTVYYLAASLERKFIDKLSSQYPSDSDIENKLEFFAKKYGLDHDVLLDALYGSWNESSDEDYGRVKQFIEKRKPSWLDSFS